MSRSADNNRTHHAVFAGVVGAAVLAASVAAQQNLNLPAREVTARTAAAAAKPDPLAFAAALASERIPAGFVIVGESTPSYDSAAISQYSMAPVSLTRAVDFFLKMHPGFTLEDQSAWALVLRSKERSSCDAPLRRSFRAPAISGSGLEAFWRLALLVSPDTIPQAPPGIVCGGGECSDLEPKTGLPVTIPPGELTLQDGLSQTAGQAGLVWLLQEVVSPQTGERSCRFSYFAGDSRMETGYVLGRSSRPR